jgi:hypothetical protein
VSYTGFMIWDRYSDRQTNYSSYILQWAWSFLRPVQVTVRVPLCVRCNAPLLMWPVSYSNWRTHICVYRSTSKYHCVVLLPCLLWRIKWGMRKINKDSIKNYIIEAWLIYYLLLHWGNWISPEFRPNVCKLSWSH